LIALFCLIAVGSAFAEVGEDSPANKNIIAQTSSTKAYKDATVSFNCFSNVGTTSEPVMVECGS